jgi:hypothetical protein
MDALLAEDVEKKLQNLIIEDENQLENAVKLTKRCGTEIKKIKETYKSEKNELQKKISEIRDKEKKELFVFENFKIKAKEAIVIYQKKVNQKYLDDIKEAQIETETFGVTLKKTTAPKKISGVHTRKTWKAIVTEEKKVPLFYKQICIRPVDVKILNEIANQEYGEANIDGVKFIPVETLVIK